MHCLDLRKIVFYPSVIFCFMWGMNCIMHSMIYAGWINPLTERSTFIYSYMDTYIIYFTIATIIGFTIAYTIYGKQSIKLNIDTVFIDRIQRNYKWIMWHTS